MTVNRGTVVDLSMVNTVSFLEVWRLYTYIIFIFSHRFNRADTAGITWEEEWTWIGNKGFEGASTVDYFFFFRYKNYKLARGFTSNSKLALLGKTAHHVLRTSCKKNQSHLWYNKPPTLFHVFVVVVINGKSSSQHAVIYVRGVACVFLYYFLTSLNPSFSFYPFPTLFMPCWRLVPSHALFLFRSPLKMRCQRMKSMSESQIGECSGLVEKNILNKQ